MAIKQSNFVRETLLVRFHRIATEVIETGSRIAGAGMNPNPGRKLPTAGVNRTGVVIIKLRVRNPSGIATGSEVLAWISIASAVIQIGHAAMSGVVASATGSVNVIANAEKIDPVNGSGIDHVTDTVTRRKGQKASGIDPVKPQRRLVRPPRRPT